MDILTEILSQYSESQFQEYLDTEELHTLHSVKLFIDDVYYNEGRDVGFSDYKYDMLKETLTRRDPEYVVPVGARIREGENRAELPFWLGSMEKIKPEDEKELERWMRKNKNREYIIEDKLDGVSCLVVINKGKVKLYTRGDGIIGADISYLVQYFNTIPKDLEDLSINIRGELIMPIDIFNEKYSNEYANPRNLVAGRVGAKKIRHGLKDIKFIAYEIVGNGTMNKPSFQLEYLRNLGFFTVNYKLVNTITVDVLTDLLTEFKNNNKFEIDGIIIQPNIRYERNIDGNPDYAFAFKMRSTDNIIETNVVDVIWNVSKWGQIKPRVEVEPVNLGGVTITYTTGFNGKYIYDNSIGPGSVVKITRSGDVIPYIVDVVKPSEFPEMPEMPWKWNETRVDIVAEESDEIICIKLITSFFSNLDIKHLGEKTVEKMHRDGLDTILKIVKATKERISQVDGIGEKGAERIFQNIRTTLKDSEIPTILGYSGVFGFGMGKKKINKLFDEIPNILTEYKKMSRDDLKERVINIEGFSEKTTDHVLDNIECADKFIISLGETITFKDKTSVNDTMKGLKVVFSGFRDSALGEEVVSRGGQVVTSISKNTDILVIISNSEKSTGKTTKARDLGIKIMTKDNFFNSYINKDE